MKQEIISLIQKSVQEVFGLSDISFTVEQPVDMSHGDYATNVALVLAKKVEKSPLIVAEMLVPVCMAQKGENIEGVTIAGPGFLNVSLYKETYAAVVHGAIEQKEAWGASTIHAGKNILVEHSSPNLFKPFHIGHLMNNTVGQSLVRLAEASGARVSTMSFPSDISLGVAKAIFILLESNPSELTIQMLGDAYVQGTARYKEDESIHARVKEIADNLYAQAQSAEWDLYQQCKSLNIAYFEGVLEELGSRFDTYIYESEAGVVGANIVQEYTPKVFTESEGAIVYVPEEARKDINTAVFINSQGNPTYEAKDIGLLSMKFERFSPDVSLFVTDNEQVPHFKVVLAAAEHINAAWQENSVHIHHGRMSFKGQKMSSRLGGVPTAEATLGAVREEVVEKAPDITKEGAQAIAIAALKFSILRAAVGKDINFDPEISLSFEGDSGPYLQYSAVRAQSVLAKATLASDATVPEGWVTTELEKVLVHFPEIVQRAIEEWSPHYLVTYLLSLAQSFNSWYGNTKIIDESVQSVYKLALTEAFAQTMQNGLHLLGMEVPEKM